jgi:predicted metalloendopeptidase
MRKFLLFVFFIVSLSNSAMGQAASDMEGFDRGVRPQDDLFLYVNGSWLANTEIPADKSNYGSFVQLDDLSRERIRDLIQELAEKDFSQGSDEQKIGDFYSSFMNTEHIEARGHAPLTSELRKIQALRDKQALFEHFGYLQTIGVSTPAGFFVSQDAKDSTRYMGQLIQSGTTLPDRDYYLNDDEKSIDARNALQVYVQTLCGLCSLDGADDAAERILELETRLAKVQIPRTELRDAEKRYNPFTIDELKKATPHLNWDRFFAALLDRELTEVNVNTPSYFDGLNSILDETDLETWKQYLRFRVIDAFAPVLNATLVDAHFELHSKTLAGISEQLPRWKRGVNAVSGDGAGDFGALGDAVGRLYVARHFPPDAKREMDVLVQNLLTAFGQSIDQLAWMTDETKARAREKLAKINTKIGYTTQWRDYSKLEVKADDLFGNTMRSNIVEFRRLLEKLGKPVNKHEWGMTPQTVNAYYNPPLNEIVFPAAILQPPFFSKDAEPALNYGGIGAVIGHEISHAFDDQGSKYDGDGNLNNWWSDKDRKAFAELTGRLVAQYAAYEPLEGKTVNGQLTLGENIADLSGLSIAHRAYRLSLDGKMPEKVAGWTGDQLFFVGWSRVWRRKYRDAEMIRRLLIDPHSPSQYRANGPVANIKSFYEAFDVKAGDALYKPESERIEIW